MERGVGQHAPVMMTRHRRHNVQLAPSMCICEDSDGRLACHKWLETPHGTGSCHLLRTVAQKRQAWRRGIDTVSTNSFLPLDASHIISGIALYIAIMRRSDAHDSTVDVSRKLQHNRVKCS